MSHNPESAPPASDDRPSPRQHGRIAALAGLIAPLVGIVLMIILSLTIDIVVGIIVGAIAMLIMVPITQRLLKRRAGL